ncbi:MAG: hypothetical protein HPY53_11160 [Brevinematales bacterium]|nr:hypothetical protein [Brevinematales bacterium]
MRKLLIFSMLLMFSVSYGKMIEISEGQSVQITVPQNEPFAIRFKGKVIKNIVILDESVLIKKVSMKKTVEGVILNTVISFSFFVEFDDNDMLPVKVIPDKKCTNIMFNIEVQKLNGIYEK